VKQFTIFIESKIGELAKVSEAIGRRGINIKAIVGEIYRVNPYIKLVTNDVQTTEKVLKNGGFDFEFKEILSIEMPDRPGELAKIAKASFRLVDFHYNERKTRFLYGVPQELRHLFYLLTGQISPQFSAIKYVCGVKLKLIGIRVNSPLGNGFFQMLEASINLCRLCTIHDQGRKYNQILVRQLSRFIGEYIGML